MALAFASFAQTHFVSRPGVQELSGRMVVRPWSESAWQARGLTLTQAQAKVREAVTKASNVIRRVTETGEIIISVPAGQTEDRIFFNLNATGLYEYVTPDYRVYPLTRPNDPFFQNQWHHAMIRSERGWALHTGHTVKIAIVDTGIDLTHPDLAPNLLPGYNSVDKVTQANGGQVMDINGHGTHCAGDAAAITNNGRGVAGVSWNVKIFPVRTSNSPGGGAFVTDMMDGARWATNNGAKVVSVSYAGVDSPLIQTTGQEMRAKGSLLFYAAGNDNRDLAGFDHADVMVIGASNEQDTKAGFSAYGKAIDVFAPGTGIVSTTLGGGYGPASGTSMACPVAAGLAALIYSYNPRLTSRQVEDIMSNSAKSWGDSNKYGFGRIDVEKAMLLTRATLTTAQVVVPSSMTQRDGTHNSGGLPEVSTIDKLFHVSTSARVTSGQSASAEATFTLPNPTKLSKIELLAAANSSDRRYTPASTVFLWNYQTSKYDIIAEGSLRAIGQDEMKRSLSGTSLTRYVNASGQVKMLFRAYSADRRNTGMAEPFRLMINRLAIGVETSN
jgi:subtilisin family serine protease